MLNVFIGIITKKIQQAERREMFRHFIYIRSRSPASTNTPSAFPFHHKDKKKGYNAALRCIPKTIGR